MANKQVTVTVATEVEDGEVKDLEALIESIKNEVAKVDVDVDDGEVDSAKAKEEELNTTAEVDIEVDDTAVQTAMSNINDGIN